MNAKQISEFIKGLKNHKKCRMIVNRKLDHIRSFAEMLDSLPDEYFDEGKDIELNITLQG